MAKFLLVLQPMKELMVWEEEISRSMTRYDNNYHCCKQFVSRYHRLWHQRQTVAEQLHELSNGVIGLSSSIRHTQDEQLKAARQSAKSLGDVQWQLSGVGKSVNTSTKESLLSIGKILSQLDTSVVKQGKSLDKTNSLLENLCATMKTLVDVEQRKSTLVAQAAKAASLAGATSVAPASSPAGSAPAGSAPAMAAGGVPGCWVLLCAALAQHLFPELQREVLQEPLQTKCLQCGAACVAADWSNGWLTKWRSLSTSCMLPSRAPQKNTRWS